MSDAVSNFRENYGLSDVIRKIHPENPALETVPIIFDLFHEMVVRNSKHNPGELKRLPPNEIKFRSQDAWGKTWLDAHHPHKIGYFCYSMTTGKFKDDPAINVWEIEGHFAALDHHRVATARLLERSSILCNVVKVDIAPQWKSINSFLIKLEKRGFHPWFSPYHRREMTEEVELSLSFPTEKRLFPLTFSLGELELLQSVHVRGNLPLSYDIVKRVREHLNEITPPDLDILRWLPEGTRRIPKSFEWIKKIFFWVSPYLQNRVD